MNSIERRQRKYLNQMLKNSQKSHKEFDKEIKEENFKKDVEFIKQRYSPNGGRNPFKKTDGK